MERDDSLYWFRFHPAKGWQMWIEDGPTFWGEANGLLMAPGTYIHDSILPWIDTWCEPEAD